MKSWLNFTRIKNFFPCPGQTNAALQQYNATIASVNMH